MASASTSASPSSSSSAAVSYGRSSSFYVTFSAPFSHCDLTPPVDDSDAAAKDKADNSDDAQNANSSTRQRELGDDAVWILSSAKVGHGVEQLRDQDPLTFWQSDGLMPHSLTIQFHKQTRVSHVCIYLDQKLDESYTPSRISIRVGSGSASSEVTRDGQPLSQGLREMDKFDLEEPQGWVVCHIGRAAAAAAEASGESTSSSSSSSSNVSPSVRCHFLQVVILSSNQNGRDTHVRQVRVYGPRQTTTYATALNGSRLGLELDNATSMEFKQYACIR